MPEPGLESGVQNIRTFIGSAKGAQGVQRLPNDGQVAVAAHKNANFFS